ncbi:cell division protein FtsK [Kribbella sp. HUAS MG21]|uniref:Cell division protein FtsK n=1 Tax=Kribbella sp. HUAS MG21 TaxID=3160966 RepID=A0AAU7TBC4_9ACTN
MPPRRPSRSTPVRPTPSRRAVVVTAVLLPGAVALTGCEDEPAGTGTPGAVNSAPPSQGPAEETPSVDPAVVAALSTAATQLTQLSQLYATSSRKFPTLKAQLAAGAKYHSSHLAKLKETAGVTAKATTAVAPAKSAQAALSAISKQEKALAGAHAAAAAKLSGAPARLLAQIAASETQLGAALAPKLARPTA